MSEAPALSRTAQDTPPTVPRTFSNTAPWLAETGLHYVRFTPGGSLLQVTFDHLDMRHDSQGQPQPWGQAFAEKNGWSLLGVVSKKHIWFREEALHDIFDALRDAGFFKRFARVVFCGGSKGGYGALTFSRACPGADVVAINPQSTLDSKLVPWETRYKIGDWTGRYIDGATATALAAKVYLFFDKYCQLDHQHAQRITGPNVHPIECNYLGHGLATCFMKMGILKDTMKSLVEGNFDPTRFRREFRLKKTATENYGRNLFNRALQKGHPKLALAICTVLKDGPDRPYHLARMALVTAALEGPKALNRTHAWLTKIGQ